MQQRIPPTARMAMLGVPGPWVQKEKQGLSGWYSTLSREGMERDQARAKLGCAPSAHSWEGSMLHPVKGSSILHPTPSPLIPRRRQFWVSSSLEQHDYAPCHTQSPEQGLILTLKWYTEHTKCSSSVNHAKFRPIECNRNLCADFKWVLPDFVVTLLVDYHKQAELQERWCWRELSKQNMCLLLGYIQITEAAPHDAGCYWWKKHFLLLPSRKHKPTLNVLRVTSWIRHLSHQRGAVPAGVFYRSATHRPLQHGNCFMDFGSVLERVGVLIMNNIHSEFNLFSLFLVLESFADPDCYWCILSP